MTSKEKIKALQKILQQEGLAAWIAPSADPHQSEYLPGHWQIRAWLSGFEGSAGTLVVTQDQAGLWVDPRYHIRGELETVGSGIELFKLKEAGVPTHSEWLADTLQKGDRVGFDSRLLAIEDVEQLQAAFKPKGILLSPSPDLIAPLWLDDRPLPSASPIRTHPLRFSGQSRQEKIAGIQAELAAQQVDAYLLTALDEIAWVFNIRGDDVRHNPVALSYSLITQEQAFLFINLEKVPLELRLELEQTEVTLDDYGNIAPLLINWPTARKILIDPGQTNYQLYQILQEHHQIVTQPSLVQKMKAIKNEQELSGFRQAYLRDGVALVKWLYWLEQVLGREEHTEISIGDKLNQLRSEGEHFQGLSFDNIIGYQANAAVGHYLARPETTPSLKAEGILLFDTGGQYLDGTTDTTRTITLGSPTPRQRAVYTAVLQSLIQLTLCRFPQGTTGAQLNSIARQPLWQRGWECRHGLGHGLGSYLNVHEGPNGFGHDNDVAFEPGMVATIEPGIYFEGAFGVRLENTIVVVEDMTNRFGSFYRFETLNLCPFDNTLIDKEQLSTNELDWLNQYHQQVLNQLSPHLNQQERTWLGRACADS